MGYKSANQYVLNWLVELLKANADTQEVNWIDAVDYAREFLDYPSGTIYRVDKEHGLHSFGTTGYEDYEYNLTFRLEIVDKRAGLTSEERPIFFYEEKIEEVIIANQDDPDNNIGGDSSIIQARVTRSHYDALLTEDEIYDTLVMIIVVDYTRQVVV
jgi:hypothetical protein